MVIINFEAHLKWLPTVSICKVGDCGLQTYQIVTILKRATTLEITTISPILYIHCYALYFIFSNAFSTSIIDVVIDMILLSLSIIMY